MRFLRKWYNYIFKRNPFQNMKEEREYIWELFYKLCIDTTDPQFDNSDCKYENWLLKIMPIPKKVLYTSK